LGQRSHDRGWRTGLLAETMKAPRGGWRFPSLALSGLALSRAAWWWGNHAPRGGCAALNHSKHRAAHRVPRLAGIRNKIRNRTVIDRPRG
jgi:hypothetical protein